MKEKIVQKFYDVEENKHILDYIQAAPFGSELFVLFNKKTYEIFEVAKDQGELSIAEYEDLVDDRSDFNIISVQTGEITEKVK